MSTATTVDNCLYGMALSNHSAYLSDNWSSDTECSTKAIMYLPGMVEHLVYMLFKIVTAVAFVFISIALTAHYIAGLATDNTEEVVTKREVRMKVGFLVLGEAIAGIPVDAVGILFPFLAYTAHECLKGQVTRRAFEKWGIIDHTLPSEQFAALDYFRKV